MTQEWLKFDNSYFKVLKEQDDEDLLVLETDGVLMTDSKFRYWSRNALLYAPSQAFLVLHAHTYDLL